MDINKPTIRDYTNAGHTHASTAQAGTLGGYVATGTTITINGTTQDLSTNRSWTVSGGTTTIATQQVWTDAFTVARTSDTVVTYTAGSSGLATIIANSLIGRLVRWVNGDGSAVWKAFVTQATASSTTVTINISGHAFPAGGATSADSALATFRVSMYETVKQADWYIPGEQVADANNPVGKWYFNRTLQDWMFLSFSAYLGTGASGAGTPTLTYNVYNGANAIFGTAPTMGTATALDNSVPSQNNPVAGGAKITLRTTALSGATTKPQDFYLIGFYANDDLWDAI